MNKWLSIIMVVSMLPLSPSSVSPLSAFGIGIFFAAFILNISEWFSAAAIRGGLA